MSRLMGMVLTLIYTIGGGITGWFINMLLIHHEELPLTLTDVIDMLHNYPMMYVGPLLIMIGILAHRMEILHAESKVDSANRKADQLAARLDEANRNLEETSHILSFCKAAIADGANRQAMSKIKGEIGNDEHPSA